MGRFKVTIAREFEKLGFETEDPLHKLKVQINEIDISSKICPTSAFFNVVEPGIRSVRVESLANYKASINQGSKSDENQNENDPEKINTVFHKKRNGNRVITYSQGVQKSNGSPSWLKSKDFSDLDLRGNGSFILVNALELTTKEKVNLQVVVDNESKQESDDEQRNTDEANENEENQNTEDLPQIPIFEPSFELPEIRSSQDLVKLTYQEQGGNETTTSSTSTQRNTVVFSVGNLLAITMELDTNFEKKNLGKIPSISKILRENKQVMEKTLERFLEPETFIKFQKEKPTFLNDTENAPTVDEENAKVERKTLQRKVMNKLVEHRLRAFPLTEDEAKNIVESWSSGYTIHRPYSYRVLNAKHFKSGLQNMKGNLTPSCRFAVDFLHHSQVLEGIINSASCTLIEATFFLLLPHFKMEDPSQNSKLVQVLAAKRCMQHWAQVLFTAAHQLKPHYQHSSVTRLIQKEMKQVGKPLDKIQKVARQLKQEANNVQIKVEKLQKKLIRRFEPRTEWMSQILGKMNAKANQASDLEEVGTPNELTQANMFENSMHLGIGSRGLLIKHLLTDKWFPFLDLNFLERRVLFLGISDHMYSSLDAVLKTLRHLLELYTPGYPNNILARVTHLFETLKKSGKPFMLLDPMTRLKLHGKLHSIVCGMERLERVLFDLVKMIHYLEKELERPGFKAADSNDVMKMILNENHDIHIVVPLASINLEGLANLNLRSCEPSWDLPTSEYGEDLQSEERKMKDEDSQFPPEPNHDSSSSLQLREPMLDSQSVY